jgi:hypothetical protein
MAIGAEAVDARPAWVPRPPLRGGWALLAREHDANREDPLLFTVLDECLLNMESLKAHLRQWTYSEVTAACSVLDINEAALARASPSRKSSKECV